MTEIVTYVEMTAPDQLNPAVPVAGLTLERIDRGSPIVPDVIARIGAPYGWKTASWTEADWAAWLPEHPGRLIWLLRLEGRPTGMVCYELHSGGDVEIETFGLLPEFLGKGLGGFALTLGVQRAWELAPPVSRVWLHTSTHDHPHALRNYHRRGFRTFKTEEGDGPIPQAMPTPAAE
jgi:GNAT superfamily N-acetyltransferase